MSVGVGSIGSLASGAEVGGGADEAVGGGARNAGSISSEGVSGLALIADIGNLTIQAVGQSAGNTGISKGGDSESFDAGLAEVEG